MPSPEGNLLSDPLGVVSVVFKRSKALDRDFGEEVQKHLKTRALNGLSWIPSLNDVPLHKLKSNCLVRYRGMIQDMYGPEIFLSQYELAEKEGGPSKELCCGWYQDLADCPPGRVVWMDSPSQALAERQVFYCVPLPGETAWAKEVYASQSNQQENPDASSQESVSQGSSDDDAMPTRKRSHADDDALTSAVEVSMGDDTTGDSSLQRGHSSAEESDSRTKRVRTATDGVAQDSSPPVAGVQSVASLNFPLPGEQGIPCLVKVYEDIESYRVNEMVEFIGVLSVDPALTSSAYSQTAEEIGVDAETAKEEAVHSPPPNVVPRLHCIAARRLPHSNPLLPVEPEAFALESASIVGNAGSCREELCRQLASILNGDQLAAQFLLLNLVSNVYARHDASVMGKFSLNLASIPASTSAATIGQLSRALAQLVPKFYCLPMSLGHLNSRSLCPKKDYSMNRLVSGELQLADGTALLLDETALTEGQLSERGIANIVAINSVLSQQRLAYDFQYQTIDFPTNVNAIVISEGKTILQVDCMVPVQADAEYQAAPPLNDHQLSVLRAYLTAVQRVEYDLSEEIQKHLQEEFVAMRKANPESVTGDTLHKLLLIARLLSVSRGQAALDMSTWNDAKQLETLRLARVAAQPAIPQAAASAAASS